MSDNVKGWLIAMTVALLGSILHAAIPAPWNFAVAFISGGVFMAIRIGWSE